MSALWLGATPDEARVEIAASVLLRHAMALGSSGSGKTVLCKVVVEEMLRQGVPAICIDPQGDLCSLAGRADPETLRAHGIDPALAVELAERIDPVVFTPGSTRGVPLCADPIDPRLGALEGAERAEAVARTAGIVASLLGYDLESDDGAGVRAAIDRALTAQLAQGTAPSLALLAEALPTASAGLVDVRKVKTACQRLARLEVGARASLFSGGVPIDIDLLLGLDARAKTPKGKARLAIVYLNTLHDQDDKDFFVATLADRLYAWMLAHPSPTPQLLFYIDEVAPFIPPVRKPACKDGLAMLFKQARKYGVTCLMATQNPGDVDYRAMAQFGTWALGRLTTRQDLKKIEPTLKALAPAAADSLLARLPALAPGRFVLLSPDAFAEPIDLRSRYLLTPHETWDEARIARATDGARERFAAFAPSEPIPLTKPKPRAPAAPRAAPRARVDPEADDHAVLERLGTNDSLSVRELAQGLDRGEAKIRRTLERLAESGQVRTFQRGRSARWWAPVSGGRPDLKDPTRVMAVVAKIDQSRAQQIAMEQRRAKVLGLLGEDETLAELEPSWRLLYRLEFEEKVERDLLGRLFGASHDDRLGSVYLHPHNFGVAEYDPQDGLRFEDRPSGAASAIRDFDGVAQLTHVPPGTLAIDEEDWRARQSTDAALASFRARFAAKPRQIEPVFVPLWQILLRSEGSLRRVTIDALSGQPVRWLGPTS